MVRNPILPKSRTWFNFLMFIYFEGQTETECEQGRVRMRGRHRIWSRLQALSCQHRARHGARTHRLWDVTPAEVGCLTNCITQALLFCFLKEWSWGHLGLSVWLQLMSWSPGMWVWAPGWALCWQLGTWSLLQILCLPLSLLLPCSHCVSLSKIN